jgi:hypothetical protein
MARWTGQGAYLDGIDGPQAPALRKESTTEMPGGLTRYLAKHPSGVTRCR